MPIYQISELHGLHGGNSKAATTSLTRYFALLASAKRDLRKLFSEDDLEEMADVVLLKYREGAVGSDVRSIVSGVAGLVSSDCAEKLGGLTPLECVALVDAIERTVNVTRPVARVATGSRFML